MIKYIGKRILMLVPVLLGVVLLVFSMMYFSPGNAEDYILGDMATEEDKEAFREEHGLNEPFVIQYINYVKDALRGDLGISYTTKQPVAEEIFKRFPTTFKLALLSTLWSIGRTDVNYFVFCSTGPASCIGLYYLEALDSAVLYHWNPFGGNRYAYDALQYAGGHPPGLYHHCQVQRTD